jgi:hypothetical protein
MINRVLYRPCYLSIQTLSSAWSTLREAYKCRKNGWVVADTKRYTFALENCLLKALNSGTRQTGTGNENRQSSSIVDGTCSGHCTWNCPGSGWPRRSSRRSFRWVWLGTCGWRAHCRPTHCGFLPRSALLRTALCLWPELWLCTCLYSADLRPACICSAIFGACSAAGERLVLLPKLKWLLPLRQAMPRWLGAGTDYTSSRKLIRAGSLGSCGLNSQVSDLFTQVPANELGLPP